MLTFHVISIFPKLVEEYTNESILKKAKEKNLVSFKFYNLRDYTEDKHKKVDDRPFGGGPGMVMNAAPILNCVEKIMENVPNKRNVKVVNFVPGGEKWTNVTAKKYARKYTDIVLLCGRYEGIDYRVQKILKAENVSIGDYVLTGGEIPSMVVIDSIARQVKGVLGDFNSLEEVRTEAGGATDEYYTRPEVLVYKNRKHKVPKVFLSGNPKLIAEYKNSKSK